MVNVGKILEGFFVMCILYYLKLSVAIFLLKMDYIHEI